MKSFEDWMKEYAVSHTHPTNVLIHKVCVPLIMFSVLGLLWAIPFPATGIALLNWATLFYVACLAFYLTLSVKYSLGMMAMGVLMLASCYWIEQSGLSLLYVSLLIFVVSWIFQFVGHKLEGKKPSFFKDLLFLLIGPLWVLRSLYRKVGLSN